VFRRQVDIIILLHLLSWLI